MPEPKTAPKPRRHHYVPKLLLKGFATERKPGKFQTNVFDKREVRTWLSPIEDVMVEGDFNAIDQGRISLEGLVGRYEDKAAPIIERIIRDRSVSWLSERQWIQLSFFAALQFIRGTGPRAQMQAVGAGFAAEIARRGFKLEADLNVTPAQAKVHALHGMAKSLHEYANQFANKDLVLFEAPAGIEYLLGDNPVVLRNSEPAGFMGNLGLACAGIEIYLPINSELALGFMCPSINWRLGESLTQVRRRLGTMKANAVLGARQLPPEANAEAIAALEGALAEVEPLASAMRSGAAYLTDRQNVIHLNSLQVAQSERFLVSRGGDFDLIHEMIAEHAEFREGGARPTIS